MVRIHPSPGRAGKSSLEQPCCAKFPLPCAINRSPHATLVDQAHRPATGARSGAELPAPPTCAEGPIGGAHPQTVDPLVHDQLEQAEIEEGDREKETERSFTLSFYCRPVPAVPVLSPAPWEQQNQAFMPLSSLVPVVPGTGCTFCWAVLSLLVTDHATTRKKSRERAPPTRLPPHRNTWPSAHSTRWLGAQAALNGITSPPWRSTSR